LIHEDLAGSSRKGGLVASIAPSLTDAQLQRAFHVTRLVVKVQGNTTALTLVLQNRHQRETRLDAKCIASMYALDTETTAASEWMEGTTMPINLGTVHLGGASSWRWHLIS